MLAFAANSILCRLALHSDVIDPFSFGSVRLVSGALTLYVIVRLRNKTHPSPIVTDWRAVLALATYVACFSYAYLTLATGTGALILFGAVQFTMILAGLRAGERFGALACAGLALALAGLGYLLSPGIAAPRLIEALSMAIAGMAWGVYSLRGRLVANPLLSTARNFALAAPIAILLNLLLAHQAHADTQGIALALTSGVVTSGLGYVIWYAALPHLSSMRAATMQLSVPLIAAFGGLVFVSDPITLRLMVASATILGGIALVLLSKPGR